jgi:hypothetical protein
MKSSENLRVPQTIFLCGVVLWKNDLEKCRASSYSLREISNFLIKLFSTLLDKP